MMKYCDPRHKHPELKASINHYRAANHWPAADTHLKPVTCSKPTRLIRYNTNLIYYTHLNSLVMWNIGLFHLFDLKMKWNQVSSSDGFQVVMNPQGIPALVLCHHGDWGAPSWPPYDARSHALTGSLLHEVRTLHWFLRETHVPVCDHWAIKHLCFLMDQRWCPSATHTHTEQPSPSPSCHARSPSINRSLCW